MAMNTTLSINHSDIWLCKKTSSTTWEEPIKHTVPVSPTNSDGEIFVYGVSFPQYLKIKNSVENAVDFNVGDRIYYKKEIPEEHNESQNSKNDANFEVISKPSLTLNIADIRLKYLVGK